MSSCVVAFLIKETGQSQRALGRGDSTGHGRPNDSQEIPKVWKGEVGVQAQ